MITCAGIFAGSRRVGIEPGRSLRRSTNPLLYCPKMVNVCHKLPHASAVGRAHSLQKYNVPTSCSAAQKWGGRKNLYSLLYTQIQYCFSAVWNPYFLFVVALIALIYQVCAADGGTCRVEFVKGGNWVELNT